MAFNFGGLLKRVSSSFTGARLTVGLPNRSIQLGRTGIRVGIGGGTFSLGSPRVNLPSNRSYRPTTSSSLKLPPGK